KASTTSAAGSTVFSSAYTTANITPRALNVVIYMDRSKVYDGTTKAPPFTLTDNPLPNDAVTVVLDVSFLDKNVAPAKTLIVTPHVGGTDGGNYSANFTPGTLTADITARQLHATPVADPKTYQGRDLNAAVTFPKDRDDRVPGDDLTVGYVSA